MKKSSLRDAVNRIFTKGLSEKMRQAFLYREAESVAKFGSLMKEITNLAHGTGNPPSHQKMSEIPRIQT